MKKHVAFWWGKPQWTSSFPTMMTQWDYPTRMKTLSLGGGKLSLPFLLWFFYPPAHSPLLRVLGAGALDDPKGWDGEGGRRGFRMENTCTPVADSFQGMNVSFTSAFSFSSFTLLKRLFSSSSLSAITVVSAAYLRLLIFLLLILIPACDSSSPAFHMRYSA